jgi:O-antigen/teichoic acid export membrane protein
MSDQCLEIKYRPRRLSVASLATTRRRLIDSPEGLKSRLLRGVFWTMVMSFIVQGSTFIGSIITARLLGYVEFGKFAMVQSAICAIAGFAGVGLSPTATKFVSELRSQAPDRAGRILGLCSIITLITGTILAIICFIAAPWVAGELLHAEELAGMIKIGAIYVLLFALNAYQIGALSGFEAFARIARISAVQGPVVLILTVSLIWPLGLKGAVMAMVIAMFSSWILYHKALCSECRLHGIRINYKYNNLRQEFPVLMHIALPAAASGVVGGLAILGANAMLVRQTEGFAQMAIFNAANCFRLLLLLIPGMVTKVSVPLLCNLRASHDILRYKRTFGVCLGINFGLSASIALILFFCAHPLLRLFGKEFSHGQGILGLLMAASVVEIVAVALFQPLYSHGRLWLHFGIISIWSSLLLAATWCFVPAFGAVALAGSYLASWMVSAVLYGIVAKRIFCESTESHSTDVALQPELLPAEVY